MKAITSKNKINFKDMLQAVKTEERYTDVEWHGKHIKIKKTIPVADVVKLVDSVTKSMFIGESTYSPETVSFLTKCRIIDAYTNVELPEDVNEGIYLVYETDLFDIVRDNASDTQLGDIMDAIDKRISYILNTNIDVVERDLHNLEETLANMNSVFGDSISGITPEDMQKFVDFISGDGFDEKKLVEAIAEHNAKKE